MSSTKTASSTTAPTDFLHVNGQSYAYRRFGNGPGLALLFLQHFTGTLDNWDPAVTDPLATGREVILFDNAGVGRSTGEVPVTIAGMGTDLFSSIRSPSPDTRRRSWPPTRSRRSSERDPCMTSRKCLAFASTRLRRPYILCRPTRPE
jgi:pimeloyl-ACP methyl ester carboxylesterase